jgi:membrane protease YdiL (CAAX protease family)
MVSQKPWQLESTLRLLMRLFLCFVIGALFVGIMRRLIGDKAVEDSLLNMVVATLSFQIAVLVFVALFLREHRVGWTEAFGFNHEWAWAVTAGILMSLVALPATWYLQQLSAEMLIQFHFRPEEQDTVRLLRETHSLPKQVYLGAMAILFAPLAEETLFRGILYPLIKQNGFPRLALWGTAVLFALVHQNLTIFVPLVFLALALTLLYEWTNNLLAPIIVHALFNAANFAMLYFANVLNRLSLQP